VEDLPVVVALLPDDVPQEQQLSLKAVFIMYRCGKGSTRAGWVVKGLGVQVETGIG
jgi:hypothetical protein